MNRICLECKRTFSRGTHLKRHQERLHNHSKPTISGIFGEYSVPQSPITNALCDADLSHLPAQAITVGDSGTPQVPYRWHSFGSSPRPMNLCNLCSTLSIERFQKPYPPGKYHTTIEHQPSFTALETSSRSGCEMCTMFLDNATQQYCKSQSCSVDEAYQQFKKVESQCGPSLVKTSSSGNTFSFELPKGQYQRSGPYDPYSGQAPPYYYETAYVSAYFLLSNYGSTIPGIKRTELAAFPDLAMARRWIDECIGGHGGCFDPSKDDDDAESNAAESNCSLLPKRVIDVESLDGEVRLFESSGQRAAYITLSHCWEISRPLTTTLANIAEHLVSIPFMLMSKTFQDAVTIARGLGFRYLWIDSLCIIQDCREDWECECPKMAQIYRDSAVTICGSDAGDGSVGLIQTRLPPTPAPYVWEHRNAETQEMEKVTIRAVTGPNDCIEYPESTEFTQDESNCPLDKRGWILQESLLSPRLLIFGKFRMYLECNEGARFEDFPDEYSSSGSYWGFKTVKYKFSCSKKSMPNGGPDIGRWHTVVEEYSRRKLSNPRDKLPALSGIANWIFKGNHKRYLAGLIEDALHEELLWLVSSDGKGSHGASSTNRQPSWSWSSTDLPVKFEDFSCEPRDLKYYPGGRTNSWLIQREEENSLAKSQEMKMVVHEMNIKLRGLDPFGEVVFGSIKLKGMLSKAHVRCTILNGRGHILAIVLREGEDRSDVRLYPDDLALWELRTKHALELSESKAKDEREEAQTLSAPDEKEIDKGPLYEIECLCVDVRRHAEAWLGLAVEPVVESEESWLDTGEYKRYRRIGVIAQERGYHGCPMAQFESTPELIELI